MNTIAHLPGWVTNNRKFQALTSTGLSELEAARDVANSALDASFNQQQKLFALLAYVDTLMEGEPVNA